jgi:hypothetical protein
MSKRRQRDPREIQMNIAAMLTRVDWTVVEELHHIPEGRSGSLQEALRVEYAAYRSAHRQLGADLPPRAALIQAVFNIRRTHPDFLPLYDASFFYEGSHMSRTLAADPLSEEIQAIAAQGGDHPRRPSFHADEADESSPAEAESHSNGYLTV